jgi:malonyl-CoA O-methyltransferase
MSFDKDAIKRSFSKAASTYDEFSGFQKDVAFEVFERLSELLQNKELAFVKAPQAPATPEGFSFLDVGSGTGRLAALVGGSIPGSKVVASDISLAMLQRAREKYGSLGLAAADCCSLPFRDGLFDSLGSSLALQWARELKTAFQEAARVLKPGGLFVFSTLGPSTLRELRDCYKAYRGVEFKDRAAIEAAVATSGLELVFLEDRVIKRQYESFYGLLKALKNIGATPPMECGKGLSPGRQLREAGRLYHERFPSPQGGVEASYELILAAARKV